MNAAAGGGRPDYITGVHGPSMGKTADMSTAEVFRIYREFKRIQKEAGITPPNPTDKEAIRRGLYGDGCGKALDGVKKSRTARHPR